jgi:hypothetical protein
MFSVHLQPLLSGGTDKFLGVGSSEKKESIIPERPKRKLKN